MSEVTSQEREIAKRIYELRFSQVKNLEEALQVCNTAIENYGESNFFFKIKGDILYEMGEYKDAIDAYMLFLERIKEQPELFTNFARFFEKAAKRFEISNHIFEKLACLIGKEEYPYVIRKGLLTILLEVYHPSEKLLMVIQTCKESYAIDKIKCEYENIKKEGKCETIVFLCSLVKDTYSKAEHNTNRFVLKRLEREKLYEAAAVLIKNILTYSKDLVDARSLFRICRERNDYADAKEFMRKRDIVHEKEFNIQYELVLFFDAEGDEKSRNQALQYIDELSEDNVPICQTLFKFYVKYNMLKQAKDIQNKILLYSEKIGGKNKREANRKETQDVIWERLQTLVSEQEHSRQLLAITELIKGFSHELGQPITNIRYAIQLYKKKNRINNKDIALEEVRLLDSILVQTERVGKLLNRFAPITSSQSQKEFFSVRKVIESVFDEMSARLSNENIEYEIIGEDNEKIYGEVLQFSQVFYNLIINAIYAINKRGSKGFIRVEQYVEDNVLIISFSDNGSGIKPELQRKIFEPFFSTKKKEIEEGGEGLGLFIVWNILKLFNGRIYVDTNYREGARFVIEITMEVEKNV